MNPNPPMVFSKPLKRYTYDITNFNALVEQFVALYLHEYEDYTSGSVPLVNELIGHTADFTRSYEYFSKKEVNPMYEPYKGFTADAPEEILMQLLRSLNIVLSPKFQCVNEAWYKEGIKDVADNKSGRELLQGILTEVNALKATLGTTSTSAPKRDRSNSDDSEPKRSSTADDYSTEATKSPASQTAPTPPTNILHPRARPTKSAT